MTPPRDDRVKIFQARTGSMVVNFNNVSVLGLPTRPCRRNVHSTKPVRHTLNLQCKPTFVMAALLAALLIESTSLGDSPQVMTLITDNGVLIGKEQLVRLEPPILSGDLDAQERRERLKEVAGGAGWKQFSRRSAVAAGFYRREICQRSMTEIASVI